VSDREAVQLFVLGEAEDGGAGDAPDPFAIAGQRVVAGQ
jgi:hypothetical protein